MRAHWGGARRGIQGHQLSGKWRFRGPDDDHESRTVLQNKAHEVATGWYQTDGRLLAYERNNKWRDTRHLYKFRYEQARDEVIKEHKYHAKPTRIRKHP